jgi:hypothetical protein
MLSKRACGFNVGLCASSLWVPAFAGMTVAFYFHT